MSNFNLKKFLTENKLTRNSTVLQENENEASNKELLLELVDSFKSGLESTDDSEYNDSISEAWCDDAVSEIMDLKDYFVSKQSREDIFEEDINEKSSTFFKATVTFSDKPGIQYGYTVNGSNEEEARQELTAKLSQEEPGREYEIVKIGSPSQPQAAAGALADIDYGSIDIDGVDTNDYPDFTDAFIAAANFEDGTPLTDEELDQLNDEMAGEIHDLAYQSLFEGKTKREQKLIKEVLKTVQKSQLTEASYFDRYDSEAANEVGRQLARIVDIFSKNAKQEAQEIEQAIAKAETDTRTTVTPLERRALTKHADWIRTLAYRMER